MKVGIRLSGWRPCGDGDVNVFDACTVTRYVRRAPGGTYPNRGSSFQHRAPGTLRGRIWTAMSGGPDMGFVSFGSLDWHRGTPWWTRSAAERPRRLPRESSGEGDRLLDASSRPA